jgi:hypothetical protein
MPQVVYTDSKGLVQSAGSGFSITTEGSVSISSSLPPVLGSGIALSLQTVTGAGGDQAAATSISATAGSLVKATGALNSGIKLPLLSACSVGQQFIVYNSGAASIKVYPDAADEFNGVAATTGILIETKTSIICIKIDDDTWMAFEPVKAVVI